jgi:hypothetical protein
MLDISAYKSKLRAKAAVEESLVGAAGTAGTRREPVQFTDAQLRIVESFTRLVTPWQRRSAYRDAVEARLSATVGDAACTAACIAASDGFIAAQLLHDAGFVRFNSAGAVRSPHSASREPSWSSNAITGRGAGR